MAAKPDAIALLKADHRKVEDLFSQYEDAKTSARKRKLARKICLELTVHTQIEEEIFYPAVRGKIAEETTTEAYVEHDAAKLLIVEIEGGDPKGEFYDAKVRVLAEQIKHHVREEEKFFTGMFAQSRRSDVDMKALGAELAERKSALAASYKKTLPKPETHTLDQVSL